MISKSEYKIPKGKLVKINLEYDDKEEKIVKLKIMGDFFAYPSESIEILEKELIGTDVNRKKLFDKIDSIIKRKNFEFIGLNSEGLTEGIMRCLK